MMPSQAIRRYGSLAAAGLFLMQAILLPVLHGWVEERPHDDCGACAHVHVPDATGHLDPAHSHPVHDAHDCALCQGLHRPALSTACDQRAPLGPATELPVHCGLRAPRGRPCRLLPPSRAPPCPQPV